jgi:hypothetical protein
MVLRLRRRQRQQYFPGTATAWWLRRGNSARTACNLTAAGGGRDLTTTRIGGHWRAPDLDRTVIEAHHPAAATHPAIANGAMVDSGVNAMVDSGVNSTARRNTYTGRAGRE